MKRTRPEPAHDFFLFAGPEHYREIREKVDALRWRKIRTVIRRETCQAYAGTFTVSVYARTLKDWLRARETFGWKTDRVKFAPQQTLELTQQEAH